MAELDRVFCIGQARKLKAPQSFALGAHTLFVAPASTAH
jgi:hypothetical protein